MDCENKKRFISLFTIFTIIILAYPSQAISATATRVKVEIPTFAIVINGQSIDNRYAQYPFVLYNGITYLPLTYHINQFVGIKIDFYNNDYYRNTRFIGIDNPRINDLIYSTITIENKGNYFADILDCTIAINSNVTSEFFDNITQSYPILKFREILYLPLTWAIARTTLGWQYSFDIKDGLVINSTQRTRPIIQLTSFQGGPAGGIGTTYYYVGKTDYVGYPASTLGGNYYFYIMHYGRKEIAFNLHNQLSCADYYMNCMLDTNGYTNPVHDIKPTLCNGIFTILCVKHNSDGVKENVLIEIDMNIGEITSMEYIPPKKV